MAPLEKSAIGPLGKGQDYLAQRVFRRGRYHGWGSKPRSYCSANNQVYARRLMGIHAEEEPVANACVLPEASGQRGQTEKMSFLELNSAEYHRCQRKVFLAVPSAAAGLKP